MYNPGLFGLPADAVVLVSNDGSVVGRTARARLLVRTFDKNQSGRMQDRITFLSSKRDEEQGMTNTFIAPLVSARLTIDRILDPDLYR